MNQLPAFRETAFTAIIGRDGQPWVTAPDLARALGYERSDTVGRLYARNAAEFSEAMTEVLPRGMADRQFDVPLTTDTRIFSLRGAHLVAMFAKTARAAAFRAWVLDVLEGLAMARTDAVADRLAAWLAPRAHCSTVEAAQALGLAPDLAESRHRAAALLRLLGWRRVWVRGCEP